VHEEGFRVEMGKGAEESEILFYRPDGELFPAVPDAPALPADPTAELVRGHRQRGIDPGSWAATPLWHGEPLDLSLAIDMVRGLEGGLERERRRKRARLDSDR
jgi:hypothetical protein